MTVHGVQDFGLEQNVKQGITQINGAKPLEYLGIN